MSVLPDISVDVMDMTDDRRLVARVVDARRGYVPRTPYTLTPRSDPKRR